MEFVENQDHIAVLTALKRFLDSPELLLQAMKVLIPLSRPGKTSKRRVAGVNDVCLMASHRVNMNNIRHIMNVSFQPIDI